MMTHNEMISVIAAHRDGKTIEFREINDSRWTTVFEPSFDFFNFNYRIKPEPLKPREFWFIKDIGHDSYRYGWTRHDVEQEGVDYLEQIHVREVLG